MMTMTMTMTMTMMMTMTLMKIVMIMKLAPMNGAKFPDFIFFKLDSVAVSLFGYMIGNIWKYVRKYLDFF